MNERLEALRSLMKERNIDIYVVPTADFHESEYVGAYFACRRYLTGFTGSAGIAIVAADEAALYTDGRYFLQAEEQLKGSGFTLFRTGEKGVPSMEAFMEEKLPEGGCIGFDGRVVNAAWGQRLKAIAEKKGGSLVTVYDLVDEIWTDRPEMSKEKIWLLPEDYTGESAASKIKRLQDKMEEENASMHIITSLDDIAWILNIRGNDVRHCPVVLSYLILSQKGCVFYVDEEKLTEEVRAYLAENGVTAAPYNDIYAVADALSEREVGRVLLDSGRINYRLYEAISKACEIVDRENPSQMMKACKNPTEVENIRYAHVKDGVALVKWLKWLKESVGKEALTEISVSDKLEAFRSEQEHFLDISFGTIAGYEEHGAIIHYGATEETNAEIQPKGFLLVDSGGHYLEGSTDITRTIVMGPVTDEQKDLFTIVLRSNLNLAAAKFPRGVSGANLDILAREPLWELGLDYRHGTGHGVGNLLNIHEGPNSFRWRIGNKNVPYEEGMITSDEPGVYLDHRFGIRHENELLCRVEEETEYGEFLGFETITYCPFDLEAVNPELLSPREKKLLNEYHKLVFRTLAPYLTNEEKLWLRYETREI
ncbi:MAG: aminopeptidase P family protein [Lachnospiraceae bacterium]|nr:aminopeptidase P family protein [Lachnospiraceae bacterium]